MMIFFSLSYPKPLSAPPSLSDLSHYKNTENLYFCFFTMLNMLQQWFCRSRIQAVCLLICISCALNLSQVGGAATSPQFQTKYFNQTLDHFRFDEVATSKWLQRYLYNDEFWG